MTEYSRTHSKFYKENTCQYIKRVGKDKSNGNRLCVNPVMLALFSCYNTCKQNGCPMGHTVADLAPPKDGVYTRVVKLEDRVLRLERRYR
ncbi:unnamed protein product [marine sediment metagenome]|uniref:Uncharacterized protein n=1 Tax=marine sediment metagenome TaxID=412755 RepID=X0ZR65_9ZZZZ